MDHLHSVAFQGHPLGYTILGPTKNINSLKRTDLVSYIKTHYTAGRMIVSAAGKKQKKKCFVLVCVGFFGCLFEFQD
jgi:predicted Zn-dependent peptidase